MESSHVRFCSGGWGGKVEWDEGVSRMRWTGRTALIDAMKGKKCPDASDEAGVRQQMHLDALDGACIRLSLPLSSLVCENMLVGSDVRDRDGYNILNKSDSCGCPRFYYCTHCVLAQAGVWWSICGAC